MDIREVIFPKEPGDAIREQLNQTQLTQPALFLIEYALAKLWMSWGVQPRRDDWSQHRRVVADV